MNSELALQDQKISFKNYICELKKICKTAGVIINSRQFNESELTLLNLDNFYINESLIYLEILNSFVEKGGNLLNARDLVKFTLSVMNFDYSDNLIKKIDPNDIIEIYGPSGRQLFRSLNFLSFTSYSVEELSAYSWMNLYSRDKVYTGKVWTAVEKIFSGVSNFVESFCEPHIVSEIYGKNKKVLMTYKFMAAAKKVNCPPVAIVCCQLKMS